VLKHRALQIIAMVVLIGLVISGPRWLTDSPPSARAETATSTQSYLDVPVGGFAEPGDEPLNWPRDHGAKRDQFAEYWLFAGLLTDNYLRKYGFQLALYRLALQPDEPLRGSAWAARDIYRAHLVVTAAGAAPQVGERYSRAALGLSGARKEPIRIWLENWKVEYKEKAMMFHLDAADADYGLNLRLVLPAAEPIALEGAGNRGYWLPGLTTDGELTLAGHSLSVSGSAMLDRLWGRTLPVGRGQLALSRMWLELDDGSALRCSQLRRRAGGGIPLGECLLRRPDGSGDRFERGAISLEPDEDGWRDLGGANYPLSWRLQLAGHGPALHITPLADELDPFTTLPMWSGTVQVSGSSPGWGLLELSNYVVSEIGCGKVRQ
jgi:predicted secreted hydrolase